MSVWDAIVVGAGPAGCAAAYDLARAGARILLVDKAEFPRLKACAGGLTRKSLRVLPYPIDPVVQRRIKEICVEKGNATRKTVRGGMELCVMTVREELDAYCLEQTRRAGACFERIGAITNIRVRREELVLETANGNYSARYMVGADGVHSRVRQLTSGGEWFRRGFAIEANVRVIDAETQPLVFDFSPVADGYGWVFPRRDHVNVGLYTEGRAKLDRARLGAYVEAHFGALAMENVVGQYLGFGAEESGAEQDRIFLAADAGGFADPGTGEGIYGAIVSGQDAAAAILKGLQGQDAGRIFARKTEKLRADLKLSKAAFRWFHSEPDAGYRALTAPLLRTALLRAYANGQNLAGLARLVKRAL